MQRCSFEVGVRNCPPHHPEERETLKVPTFNRNKEQSTICLTHAPRIPRHRERHACYALALLPSAKLRREKKRNSPVS
ncbi:unnamed protein product [Withania somnifera]